MRELQLAAPYVVAIVIYLIAPLLSKLVAAIVEAAINKARVAAASTEKLDEATVPYYLAGNAISDYVEYASDAVQTIPVVVLPIIGAIYGFSTMPAPASVTFLAGTFLVAIAMMCWILTRTPSDYVGDKKHGFSILTIVGILLNVVGMALALSFS